MEIEHSDKKYRVLKELGRGHSGTVYLSLDPQDRQVAIKCLASQCNATTFQRFQQEFVTLRSLQHPNIAQPIDFGFDERLQRYFFVAEYVQGVSLDVALHLAEEETALRLFSQALRALDYMHRQGVFHCDLKPGNILVTADGVLKIIDFDVAVRGTKAIGGTPSYCAPELLGGEDPRPDAKSDLFSLGATFYHCLTREKPYQARSFQELVVTHETQHPSLPSEINPRLGVTWDGLLMGLLQTDPSQRYATASAVLQQIHPLLGQKKAIFSQEDLAYRLKQHGLPIGKDTILPQIEYLFDEDPASDRAKRVVLLYGAPGLGASYCADEIKAMAQLRGIHCYLSSKEQSPPRRKLPFVWILDDLASLFAQPPRERAQDLSSQLKELFHKRAAQRWWLVLTGFESAAQLPVELRALLQDHALPLLLRPWEPRDTQAWLSDIFQTEEIPSFLTENLHHESAGNPKHAAQLLNHYLSSGLILEPQGSWRKDLFHPDPLFVRQFHNDGDTEEFESRLSGLLPLERDLLEWLALSYRPMPDDFFEKLLRDPEVHASLRRLTALGLAAVTSAGTYRIASVGLQHFLIKKYSQPTLHERHDRLALLAVADETREYFDAEASAFHRANGRDRLAASLAWAELGDLSARRGLWQSAQEYYRQAYENAPESEIDPRFQQAIAQGRCLVQRGLLDDAKEYLESLLQQFNRQRKKNRRFLANLFERLGVIETKRGKLAKARTYFRAGMRCLEPVGQPSEQYLALKNFLGNIELLSGNYAAAVTSFRESFAEAESLPWNRRRILTNNDLGAALLKNGQVDEALAHWKSQLPDLERREDKNPLVRCLFQLGQSHLERGEEALARDYLKRAVAASKGLQNFEMEIRLYNALANLDKVLHPESALTNYERALDAAFQTNDAFSSGVVLLNMGFLLAERHQAARARHCLSQGLRYLASLPEAPVKFAEYFHSAHLELSRLCAELLQSGEAVAEARKALSYVDTNPQFEAQRFETLGALWQALTLARDFDAAQTVRTRLEAMAEKPETRDKLRILEDRKNELEALLADKEICV